MNKPNSKIRQDHPKSLNKVSNNHPVFKFNNLKITQAAGLNN